LVRWTAGTGQRRSRPRLSTSSDIITLNARRRINVGFNLSWWDRLLGTYCPQPAGGHEQMIIGIDIFRDPTELRLARMLRQPFKSGIGNYPISRRAA